jgi:hypothetical protein
VPRTFHAFIVASTTIILLGAFVVTRTTGPVVFGFGALDGVALLMGASGLAITSLVRQRLPGFSGDPEEWWRVNLGRAVLIWVFFEVPAVIGAITLMATRHVPAFGLLGTMALAGLMASRPSKLVTVGR